MTKPAIAVFTSYPDCFSKAKALAEALSLSLVSDEQNDYDFLLILTPDYLGLKKTGSKSHPLHIDFLSGKLSFRRKQIGLRKEALARALGLKANTQPTIVDATAGLAQDSFILACLGFRVTLLERSPIIHALVEDGIRRGAKDPAVERLRLIRADAVSWLKNCKNAERPDLIYLDPMFPERKKSALTKETMRLLHEIVGDDPDADRLLPAALSCAKQRIVVKRPRLAPSLEGPAPSFSLTGSSSRFDVYLI